MSATIEALHTALVETSGALMKKTGMCPHPQVHILCEDLDRMYLGYVSCRRFFPGADAAEAVTALGLLPSVLKATRLLVLWEDCDLRRALEMPRTAAEKGICVLDARTTGHTLHWHPFDAEAGYEGPAGLPTAIPHWRAPAQHEEARLLPPIAGMLAEWREFRTDDLQETAIGLQKKGYTLNWANFS
jgi:hypothetical protein